MVSCELLCTLNVIVDIVYIGYNDEKKVGAMVWTRKGLAELGFLATKKGLIRQNSISRERLVVRSSWNPHFNLTGIGTFLFVSHIMYTPQTNRNG